MPDLATPRRTIASVTATLLAAVLVGPLAGLATAPADATFPGVNGLVLFNRGGNLFTATATGGSITQLTTSGGITGAKWSPDGRSIAYRRGTSLLVRTYAGGATRTVATGVDSAPQWSPDGSRLAYLDTLPGAPCGEQAVYTVPAAGGTATKSFDPLSDNCPAGEDVFGVGTYLPSGRLLLTLCNGWFNTFCAIRSVTMDGSNAFSEITRISCDGEDLSPVQRCTVDLHLSDARTASAGSGVVFSGRGGYEPPTGTLPGSTATPTSTTPERVYTVDVAGTRLRTMSTATSGNSPVLSPDGKIVLFTQASGSASNLMKSGTASSSAATLFIANASQADWRPVT